MHLELILRFDYGSVVPWVQRVDGGITATAGPDLARVIAGPTAPRQGPDHRGRLRGLRGGAHPVRPDVPRLVRAPSPTGSTPRRLLVETETLVAGMVVAVQIPGALARPGPPLAHHPEGPDLRRPAGSWPRRRPRSPSTPGASGTGTTGSAGSATPPSPSTPWPTRATWRRPKPGEAGSRRAVGGTMGTLQIMYGIDGRRRLDERGIALARRLRGVQAGPDRQRGLRRNSSSTSSASWPPRCTNAGRAGLSSLGERLGRGQGALRQTLETLWREPDDGIWEVRGPRRHFTHSKIMAWVAFNSAVKSAEEFGLDGPVDRWRAAPRRDPRRGLPRGVQRRPGGLRPVLRLGPARREPAPDPACSASCRRTTPGSSPRSRPSSAS